MGDDGDLLRFVRKKGRWASCLALLVTLLFILSGFWGWDDIEGQTVDRNWHGLLTYAEVDGESPIGGLAAFLFALPLLSSTVAWLWAPLGGHVGRLATLILFVLTLHFVATNTEVVPASKGQAGWSSRILGGTKSRGWTESYNRELGILVAYRDVIGYGAGMSFWSAIGGVAVCVISLLQCVHRFGRRYSAGVEGYPGVSSPHEPEARWRGST